MSISDKDASHGQVNEQADEMRSKVSQIHWLFSEKRVIPVMNSKEVVSVLVLV